MSTRTWVNLTKFLAMVFKFFSASNNITWKENLQLCLSTVFDVKLLDTQLKC